MKRSRVVSIVIVLCLIALIGIIIFWYGRGKHKRSPEIIADGNVIIDFPLSEGSSGYGVEQVQKYLNGKYNAGLTVDGSWGPVTDLAVSNYLNRDNISESVYYKWNLDKI